MRCRAAGLLCKLVLVAGVCSGQTTQPSHYIEIKLPSGVVSESFFVRYVLAGEDFGGWVQPLSGVSSYLISTEVGGLPAAGIKAILYAPGCAIQTLHLALGQQNPQYSFNCKPVHTISITGAIKHADRLYGRDVQVQARYVARWAQPFLGIGNDTVMSIQVGDPASLSADGSFHLTIPDLSQDPLAGTPGQAGELQIWARDKAGEDFVAQLIPAVPDSLQAPMSGLRLQNAYPDIMFVPCASNPPRVYDRWGFALRPDSVVACDR